MEYDLIWSNIYGVANKLRLYPDDIYHIGKVNSILVIKYKLSVIRWVLMAVNDIMDDNYN